jgi:hypothetical protein
MKGFVMTEARLYFEAHITVDRPELKSDKWNIFFLIGMREDWKCSKFDQDDVDGYHDKWFMSARDTDFEQLKTCMKDTIQKLTSHGFNVIRWKIEDTVLDSKYGDTL